jgi:hypothetical protein
LFREGGAVNRTSLTAPIAGFPGQVSGAPPLAGLLDDPRPQEFVSMRALFKNIRVVANFGGKGLVNREHAEQNPRRLATANLLSCFISIGRNSNRAADVEANEVGSIVRRPCPRISRISANT